MSPVRICLLLATLCLASCASLEDSPFSEKNGAVPSLESAVFKATLKKEAQAEWVEGNAIKTLVNGSEYFPEMLAAVKSAKKTITFETFVAVDGRVTYDLVMAMCAKAKAGVKVHVILDQIGSKRLHENYLKVLENCGAEVELYRPFNYFRPLYGNNRDHRKILVVDGKLGFTGGAGYADCWNGDASHKGEWRDTMYRLEGPMVADLQRAFADNWKEERGVALRGEGYYPRLKKRGAVMAQVALGAPCERGDTLGASCLLAIDAAKDSILLEHAYFLPNKQMRKALVRACERGVTVELIAPNHYIDARAVRQVSKSRWPELLDAGVKIYEFQPSMMHGKLMVVDDVFAVIGSGNFDDRSFFHNDELNVHVLDRAFAQEQRRMFEHDRSRSKRMGYKDTKSSFRNLGRRWVGRLIEHQL